MTALYELFHQHGADKIRPEITHFASCYELLRQTWPETGTLLEIGVSRGGSIRAWHDWLPGWRLIGVDDDPRCPGLGLPATIVYASQDDHHAMHQVASEYGPFDVVIDDGGHRSRQHMESWRYLWPMLHHGGWYVVEDLETCHLSTFWDAGYPPFTEAVMRPTLERLNNGLGTDVSAMLCWPYLVAIRKQETAHNGYSHKRS